MFKPLLALRLLFLSLIAGILCVSCGEAEPELLPEKCISAVFEGDIHLNSQAAVNQFGETCYKAVDGVLQIGDFDSNSDISDLSPLGDIRRVSELKIVANPKLSSLAGLENLTQVEERILIHNNATLASLEELSGIRNEHISVTIYRNAALRGLTGLEGIRRYNNLDLVENTQLTDLNALAQTERINCLYLEKNDQLRSLDGLESLNSLNCLYIMQNPNLVDYCALSPVFIQQGNQPEFLCSQNGFDVTFEELEQGRCSK